MPVVMNQTAGIVGIPTGQKQSGNRVDFDPPKFDIVIETKGYRLAWSRAALCPCNPINDQTKQPDPTCSICRGSGWLYFAPAAAVVDELQIGELTDVQKFIVNDAGGVIRGLMTGLTNDKEQYGQIGARLQGVCNVTVRSDNKLGYHDRLVNLDSLIVFSEILEQVDTSTPTETRYPIVQINLIRDENQTYQSPRDFDIDTQGRIVWNIAGSGAVLPTAANQLTIHYLCHPMWLVVNHPHAVRQSPVSFKQTNPTTPMGTETPLPVQGVAQLEFIPDIRT